MRRAEFGVQAFYLNVNKTQFRSWDHHHILAISHRTWMLQNKVSKLFLHPTANLMQPSSFIATQDNIFPCNEIVKLFNRRGVAYVKEILVRPCI